MKTATLDGEDFTQFLQKDSSNKVHVSSIPVVFLHTPAYRRRIRDELSKVATQLKDIGFDAQEVDVQLTTLALEMQRPQVRTSSLIS